MKVRRGEVVLIDFPYSDNTGSKVRPALVVQVDTLNQRLDDTILALITSSWHRRMGAATQLVNELPRSKLRGIKPPLADSHGPASLAGSYSWSVWMACRRTLEQPQLDVLTMQLRIVLCTALLPHILADDGCIPMTTYRTDEGAFGPQLATPQTLFDGRDAVKDLAGRETFDDLDDLRRTVARHRLHQKMDMILVGTDL